MSNEFYADIAKPPCIHFDYNRFPPCGLLFHLCKILYMKQYKTNSKPRLRCAYCTFLINNDSYLPGILTFAYALKKQRLQGELLCIVTQEISHECIRFISRLYDAVFCVEQSLVANVNRGKRCDREKLFVRFAVLDVLEKHHVHYDKIIICDSDLLPLRNFSQLCRHPAPSGILNEKKENVIGFNEKNQWIWYDVYQDIPPKALIPKEVTDRVKTDPTNLGVNSAIYILENNTILYDEITQDLNNEEVSTMISKFPWPDMQYMTYKLSGKWHNLDIRYASFNSFPNLHSIFGTHYAGMKPWEIHNKSYLHYCCHEDYKLWICVFLNMMREYPVLKKSGRLKKLQNFLLDLVKSDRQYVLNVKLYPELKHLL